MKDEQVKICREKKWDHGFPGVTIKIPWSTNVIVVFPRL